MQLLLDRGANPNQPDEDGDTPLFVCETIQSVEILLAAGADPTIRNEEGKTAAEAAAEDSDRRAVAELLRTRFPETFNADNVTEPIDEDAAFEANFEAMMQAANSVDSAHGSSDESDA
jgi:ankyrin repeat protein